MRQLNSRILSYKNNSVKPRLLSRKLRKKPSNFCRDLCFMTSKIRVALRWRLMESSFLTMMTSVAMT